MKYLLYLFLFTSVLSCAQQKQPLLGETDWQREQNADFKDASKSPLKAKDRKTFRTLDFFKFDSTFVVSATLKRTPDSKWFKMKTTTNRVSKERVFGVLSFPLNGKTYQLKVYQGQDLMQKEGFEDYLFLPFLDTTNGDTTYGGGRYIDLRIPKDDYLVIDFNKAYNPYCAYNEKYSCPIVPRDNYVDENIEAGVKVFVK
ncbi:DUF1684 domain-containing protein [Oceanihabitans sp. 2_MG-2023]|uniref:DUF1684 domain-containing protein n=1 Tax=Oceanihabitans sp. 2_MG-2023 TaxID=3062661 RepID=UPI0026E146A9|nr:DUF1684 domain-containing protein [Oceanihabitans sp. 2_MG-2023]MDO6598371.1 DUF1684 domain-containing protein [Oceanihabitans sp. 2_MG-2023]